MMRLNSLFVIGLFLSSSVLADEQADKDLIVEYIKGNSSRIEEKLNRLWQYAPSGSAFTVAFGKIKLVELANLIQQKIPYDPAKSLSDTCSLEELQRVDFQIPEAGLNVMLESLAMLSDVFELQIKLDLRPEQTAMAFKLAGLAKILETLQSCYFQGKCLSFDEAVFSDPELLEASMAVNEVLAYVKMRLLKAALRNQLPDEAKKWVLSLMQIDVGTFGTKALWDHVVSKPLFPNVDAKKDLCQYQALGLFLEYLKTRYTSILARSSSGGDL